MIKHIILTLFTLTTIASCNSQKMANNSSSKETDPNNQEAIIQRYIQTYQFKNPEISYNSDKSFALCTDTFQGNQLAKRIYFFIYNTIKDSIVEKSSIIGDVYWENDYTIVVSPYQGIVQKNDLKSLNKTSKKIHLKN